MRTLDLLGGCHILLQVTHGVFPGLQAFCEEF